MNYQVIYESRGGNTKAVAEAIMAVLPAGAALVDISTQVPSRDADVYCIGYGVHSGTCSLNLLDFMEVLNGKTILLFATCGMEPTEEYRKVLERSIEAFLPDECDYRGMFLCQGAIPEEGVTMLRSHMEKAGEKEKLKQLDELFTRSQAHPDFQDLEAAAQFVKAVLQL